MRSSLLMLLVCCATTLRAQSRDWPTGFPNRCHTNEVQVMLLGTYHFANPGADVIRQDIDDVLHPHRQAQLQDLVARLARWRPDHIAVEWPVSSSDSLQARYARFRAGALANDRNEIVQIGFRLAIRLGHERVFAVDDDSFLDWNDSLRAVEARRPELRARRDSIVGLLQADTKRVNAWMRTTSIRQHLYRLNGDEALHGGNSLGMFGGYLESGEGSNYGGPQYLAQWYARSFNMVHNLTRVDGLRARRILLLVGSGHVPPLRSLLDEAPQFCPVSPLPFLREVGTAR